MAGNFIGTDVTGTVRLANISNAFEPWDTDATLAKDRHPLRGFDPAITGDRWRGEAFPQNAHSEKR